MTQLFPIKSRDVAEAYTRDTPKLLLARGDTTIWQTPWVIVALAAAALLLVTIPLFVTLYFLRKRRIEREARQLPYIESEQELGQTRQSKKAKRKLSAADRAQLEEQERSIMIRKSLASRSSISTHGTRHSRLYESARNSRALEDMPSDMRDMRDDESIIEAPQVDWKEWEARSRAQRSSSQLQDPALHGNGHPALAHELSELSNPRQPRSASPTRNVLDSRQKMPLPPLPPQRALQA